MSDFENKRPYQTLGLILREELSNGLYPVGSRLPPERDIADRLNVGRTVVREAIIMLELENLVEVKKGSGVYVINLPNEEGDTLNNNQQNDNDAGPFEMLQARQLLESNIAEFAAIQATPRDIERMRDALLMEKKDVNNGIYDSVGDKLFHQYIAEATQNSVLVDLWKISWERRETSAMWKKLHSHIVLDNYRSEWLEDHDTILSAMQRKDPISAKNAMWQHLEHVKSRLLELSDANDPKFDGYLFNSAPVITVSD